MKILGVGLARTGTMSLKLALEQLEEGPCFHMIELLKQPDKVRYLKEFHKTGNTNWNAFFDGFQSSVDHPTCLYYKELLKIYPDAKIILTIRDPEEWYKSVKNTVYRGKPKGFYDIIRMIWNTIRSSDTRRLAPVFMHNDTIIWKGQFNNEFDDKQKAIAIYNQHIEEVKKHVPSHQLLVYKVTDGWEPLCKFLEKNIPSTPFPKANQMDEFNKKMDRLLIDGVFEE